MGTNEDDIMYKMNDEVAGMVVKRDFLQFLNTWVFYSSCASSFLVLLINLEHCVFSEHNAWLSPSSHAAIASSSPSLFLFHNMCFLIISHAHNSEEGHFAFPQYVSVLPWFLQYFFSVFWINMECCHSICSCWLSLLPSQKDFFVSFCSL